MQPRVPLGMAWLPGIWLIHVLSYISPVDRGATLPEVQATLGHDNIAISGYLHGRPDTSSGLHLDPGVFLDETEASRKR